MRTALLLGALSSALSNVVAEELPTFELHGTVTTPRRFEAPLEREPVSVSVISREQIEYSPLQTLPELIARQVGINVQDLYGNNASNSTLELRGFGATGKQNTLILLDGKRISDIDQTSVQWAGIPLDAIERIEIVRGSGAVLYGEGATSGVINLITRKPAKNKTTGDISASLGSYNTHQVNGYVSHSGENFGIQIAASDFRSDGYRDNNHNNQQNLFSTLRWDSTLGEWLLRLAADRQDVRLPGARLIQPSIGLNEYISDRRGAQTPLDFSSRDGNTVALAWSHKFTTLEASAEISLRDKTQKSYFDQSGFPDYREIELSVLGFTPRIKFALDARQSLIAGVDLYRWDYDLRRANAVVNIGRPINHVTATEETLGYYLQYHGTFADKTHLTLGARGERLRIDGNDVFDVTAPGAGFGSGAPSANQRARQFAYEVGLRQHLSAAWSGFAKIGRSYRFANIDEVYESDVNFNNGFQFLRPQTALDRQLGLEYAAGTHRARVTLFHTDIKDEIHLDPYTTGTGNTNLPPSRRQGIELEGRTQFTQQLRLNANYSYTDAKFRNGTLPGGFFTRTNVAIAGKQVPLVSRHKANAELLWLPNQHHTWSLSATYASAQFLDNDEPNDLGVKIPAYIVADAKYVYQEGHWKFTLALNNLFDKQYYNYAVRSQFTSDRYAVYPLPGRNATATVSYHFD